MISLEEKRLDIAEITRHFKVEFGNLSVDQLNWKPHTAVWSIAQNIDHLIVINSTYFPIAEQIRTGNYRLPWMAKLPFLVGMFGRLITRSVHPNRKTKIKTFPIWEPSSSKLPADILTKFETHQYELASFMSSCDDLIAKGQVISSPANRNIVYTLETAFDIIITHERRHLAQALEVRALPGFPV